MGEDIVTKAESELDRLRRDGELRYHRLLDDLPDPIFVHVAGRVVYANPAAARLIGLPDPEPLIGHSIFTFATPATRALMEARIASAGDAAELEVVRQTFVRPTDGREMHVEVKAIRILHEGQPAILGIVRDMTRAVEAEREAAKALRAADLGRRRLEAVLAALPVGVVLADTDGRITQSNPATAAIWRGQLEFAETTAGYGVYRAFWPATGKAVAADEWAMARTLATGAAVPAEEMAIVRFDGTRGHILNSTAPILGEDGIMIGAVAVNVDVTDVRAAALERERLVVSLEFERNRLGTLLERSPAFIAVVRGEDHVFELANQAYRALTGGRPLLGRPLLEAMPEIRGQGFAEMLDGVRASGEAFSAQRVPVMLARLPGQAAQRRYVDFVCQPMVEADGTIPGVFMHGFDVTEATLALQRVQAQFDGVPVPTYVWQRVERDGAASFALIDFNEAAIRASNGDIAEHRGEAAEVYFADIPSVLEDLARCLDRGEAIQREMDRESKPGGEIRRHCVTYAPAPPDLVIVHTEDITERTRLEQQLHQAQKMEAVGRLAGGIAHDFNNLLSVMLSYTDLALGDLAADDPLRADLVEIQSAGNRASSLTRQLLAFSRQQVLQPRVLDLAQIVQAMQAMLGRLLGEDVEVSVRAAAGLGKILADAGQLEQVVMNLAVNARDAMSEGGHLTIELANVELDASYASAHLGVAPGAYVMLAVSDTGTGMDAATKARLFEPFFTTKPPGKGTGLGLATVFGIVRQSGGHIGVYTELERGSTFKVYLPRTDQRADAAGPVRERGAPRGSETILLVEDEAQVRAVASRILLRQGYRVLEASDGEDAIRIFDAAEVPIDLLLTDVVMPRMSGRRLVEQLAARRPSLRVLFVSGYTDDAIVHHGVLADGVAFLQKPFTPDSLARKVRTVLDAPDPAAG